MSLDYGINQDVRSTMDAYRGNPNALAQKYSQNQQLIDLLALQKLKSEKEAAAREMQMKMGGQQMPTIAEAREGEVLDLTKQELAQQSTGAMQQQQRQKQQAAKQLVEQTAQGGMQAPVPGAMQSPMMGGVAGLPAPNIAPKAMATGGIVAFQSGGVSSDPLASVSGMSPEDIERDRERVERIRQEEERRRAERTEYDRQAGLVGAAPPVTTAQAEAQDIENGRSQAPTATAAPRAPAAAPTGAAPSTGIAGIDPRAIAMRNEIAKYIGLTPEELAQRKQMQGERAAMDAARFDPDRRRSEGLTRWLLGAAGRTGIGSVLAGAGAAAENYSESMDQQERQALVDRQKQLEAATATDVGVRKVATDLGFKTATDYAQIAAKQAEVALGRASLTQSKALHELTTLEGRFQNAIKIANDNYANELKNIGIFPGQQPTPEQQRLLQAADLRRKQDILGAQQRMEPLIQLASNAAGIPSAGAAGQFRLNSVTPAPTRN